MQVEFEQNQIIGLIQRIKPISITKLSFEIQKESLKVTPARTKGERQIF